MAKKCSYLKKYFELREGPAGLYPEPLLWKEGPEMEGFAGNFFYTFVTKPTQFHPVEGAVIHPYNEVLVFASLDLDDILQLHGELTIELGEEREVYTITEPSFVCIPAGLQHGPVKVNHVERPFVHFAMGIEGDGSYKEQKIPAAELKDPVPGEKYAHLIKPLRTNMDNIINDPDMNPEKLMADLEEQGISLGSGMGYEALMDNKGVLRSAFVQMGPGNADQMVWIFGNDMEDFNLNFSWGFYNSPGKWHRHGEVHVHPEEEILIFVGLDPEKPMDLGAEVELGMGWDDERIVISKKPGLYICPKGLPHLPEITRWVDRPFGFIVCNIDSGHSSPWIEVDEDGSILDSEREKEFEF